MATPEQEKIIDAFDEMWKNINWEEVRERARQLSSISVEELFRPFDI